MFIYSHLRYAVDNVAEHNDRQGSNTNNSIENADMDTKYIEWLMNS